MNENTTNNNHLPNDEIEGCAEITSNVIRDTNSSNLVHESQTQVIDYIQSQAKLTNVPDIDNKQNKTVITLDTT